MSNPGESPPEVLPDLNKKPIYWLDLDDITFVNLNLKFSPPRKPGSENTLDSSSILAVKFPDHMVNGYYNPDGELIRLESGPGVLEFIPTSKEAALASVLRGPATPDTLHPGITADNSLNDLNRVIDLNLKILNAGLTQTPSDSTQTVTKDGDGWLVDIHPALFPYTGSDPVELAKMATMSKNGFSPAL